MLILKSVRKLLDRSMVRLKGSHQRSLSLRVQGFAPEHSHRCSTPWSVFQDGPLRTITPASSPEGAILGPTDGIRHGTITLPGGSYFSQAFIPPVKPMLARVRTKCTSEERWMIRPARVWSQALPFQQFHVLFNPLSKVLFIFRSLYLCAIGLWQIFSFRRNLPPA